MQVQKCNPKYWEQNRVPPPPSQKNKNKIKQKKRVKFFAKSCGSVTAIGVFKTDAKQKIGEIVFVFREI